MSDSGFPRINTAVSSLFVDLPDIGSPGVDGPPVMPEDPYAYVFMPPEDEILPAEEQPLPAAVSPTADSPGYDESSDNDKDEDVDPALADSTVVALPAINHASSAEETEPFETEESVATPPPHPAYRVTTKISIRDEPPISFWSDTEVARLLAIPTPPPSPLSSWSSPLPQIPSPPLPPILSPLPVSPPLPVSSPPPASPIRSLGYECVIQADELEAPTADITEDTLQTRSRLGITLGQRYEVGESSSSPTARPPRGFKAVYGFVATIDREIMQDLERDVGYGITDTWDEMPVDMPGAPVTDDTVLGRWMTEFTTRVKQDTNEIYTRRAHAHTAMLMKAEARISREAWGRSMNATDHRRQAAITEMLAADHRRQAQFIEALKLLKRLQTQMTEFKRQQGPAKGPAQPDAPEEAGSSS
ncbi:hypothetical protein Tco_0530438 [Tanacetum coccineum]